MSTFSGEAAADKLLARGTNTPGMCLQYVSQATGVYYVGTDNPGFYSYAMRAYTATPAARRYTDRTPPKGGIVYFSAGSNGFGHICISMGGGQVVTTDWPTGKIAVTTISAIEKSWGRTYLGWSDWLMGHTITHASTASTAGGSTSSISTNGDDGMSNYEYKKNTKHVSLAKGKAVALSPDGKQAYIANKVNSSSRETGVLTFGISLEKGAKESVQLRGVLQGVSGGKVSGEQKYQIVEVIPTPGYTFGQYVLAYTVPAGHRLHVEATSQQGATIEWVEMTKVF